MTLQQRNAKQLKIASWIARRRGIELLAAIQLIAPAFARKYPN